MDRRYEAWRNLSLSGIGIPAVVVQDERSVKDGALKAHTLTEGKHTEFWQIVKTEIDGQIRIEEMRFLDRLAPNYEVYLQAWSRRQALIAALAIPETISPTKE